MCGGITAAKAIRLFGNGGIVRRNHSNFFLTACIPILSALSVTGCDALGVGDRAQIKEQIRQSFVDPSSVRFGDFSRCPADEDMWRGDVEAKNLMGVYTGEKPFFYKESILTTVGDRRFIKVMNECYGKADQIWISSRSVNPIDDSQTVIVTGSADPDLTTGTDNDISLSIRCESGKTEMWVNWGDYLGDDSHDVYSEWKRVTVRVGKDAARTERWNISTDESATFAPGSPVALIRKMAEADQIVFQTTPYSEGQVTAVFKLDGFSQSASDAAKQCGWSLAG